MVELTKIGKENPIEQREKFLAGLHENRGEEGILLKTCNRVEWYCGNGKISEEITRHLFRVVSGLESTIIGETAIVNQVKQAYRDAAERAPLDKSLHKLFQTALFVGKRVRRETGISKGAMSHGQAAVNILFQHVGNMKDINITVIGVNSLNEKILKFLVSKGAETIFIGNRTYEKAKELAARYNANALRFERLPEILEKTDVLISATSAPHFIIRKENFYINKKMYILDLAVPRDVDPAIKDLPNVTLFDIETIERHIQQNVQVRAEKILHAEEIIKNEVRLFQKINGNETR
jgi:glutamyl-tRNA reductase